MTTTEIVNKLADEAIAKGGEANDVNGVVREVVEAHGLSFFCWFCVCCEIADRAARSRGFANAVDEAMQKTLQKRKA